MSADKHKIHDRAMKLLTKIGQGISYKREGGIGNSKELNYLLKNKLVKIIRYNDIGNPFGNHIRKSKVVKFLE